MSQTWVLLMFYTFYNTYMYTQASPTYLMYADEYCEVELSCEKSLCYNEVHVLYYYILFSHAAAVRPRFVKCCCCLSSSWRCDVLTFGFRKMCVDDVHCALKPNKNELCSQHTELNTRTECRGPTYTVHHYIRYLCVSNCSLADIRETFPAGWMPMLKVACSGFYGGCQSTWRGLLVEQAPYLIQPCDA